MRSFALEEGNRLAFQAARTVSLSKTSRELFNPLLFYGPPSSGKSHLMSAIAYHAHRREPGRLVWSSGKALLYWLRRYRADGRLSAFRAACSRVAFWFFDGYGSFAGEKAGLCEVPNLFDQLQENGVQLVLSGRQHPASLPKLSEELRARFLCGLDLAVTPLSADGMCTVLRNLWNGPAPSTEAVFLPLVQKSAGDLGQAKKWLRISCSKIGNRRPTAAFFRELLGELGPEPGGRLDRDRILRSVCREFSLAREQLAGKSRRRPVVRGRWIFFYLCRELGQGTLADVGRQLDRSLSYVSSSIGKLKEEAAKDVALRASLASLMDELAPLATGGQRRKEIGQCEPKAQSSESLRRDVIERQCELSS